MGRKGQVRQGLARIREPRVPARLKSRAGHSGGVRRGSAGRGMERQCQAVLGAARQGFRHGRQSASDIMKTPSASRYPLDVDALTKGSIISVGDLEKITGTSRHTEAYGWSVLVIRAEIERRFQEKGIVVSCCMVDGALHVLDDNAAVRYAEQRFAKGMRTMAQAHHKLLGVDTTQLSEELKPRHERSVMVQSKVLQAALGAKREALKPVVHQRTTPKLGQ